MWIILILLLVGTLAGFLASGLKGFNRTTEKATIYIIYILLFLMGLGVGTKPEIMNKLGSIGFDALLIALFAIAGSILVAYILYRSIFRHNEE